MAITEIEIRPADRSDAEEIAAAHRDSILSVGSRFYPQHVVDDWLEAVAPDLYLQAMRGGEVFFIATGQVDGRSLALGFGSDYRIEGSTHGTSVYVRGLAARQGIGSALLRRAEAHAADNGATRIQIDASLAGAAFYTANGYTEIGRGETRLMSGRSIACVFMRKDLARTRSSGRAT